MSSASPGPLCPRCRRKLAAWKLDHCIYCGERFPENLKEGFTEPEALKFVERPPVPPEAVRQLEMLKYVELGAKEKPGKKLGTALVLASMPVFAGIFYMLYRLLSRWVPSAGMIVAVLGLVFLSYVVWTLAKASR